MTRSVSAVGALRKPRLHLMHSDPPPNTSHPRQMPSTGVSLDTQLSQIDRLEHKPYFKKLPQPKTVYVVDFFCGCGGMSYGFAQTRQSHWAFEMLGGIDVDPIALETYQKNIPAKGILADVFRIAKDPNLLLTLLERDDLSTLRPLVFIGCAPCQGFSALRKGDHRDDPRNSLMMAFATIVAHYRPDVVVMENVPEILKGRFSKYFDVAAVKLQRAGYSITSGIVDSSGFGVPQKRKRALIVGSLRGQIKLPEPPLDPEQALTVRHAISHLRPLVAGEVDPYDPLHRAPNHTARLLEMFKLIPADGGDRRDLPSHLKLEAHKRLDKGSTPGFTDVYGRLRWDTPSVTITAKSRSPGSGRFLHPEQHRNISVREAAILQGFPQSFSFAGTPTRQYRNIGEAVPPTLARFIASSILDHFSPQTGITADLLFRPNQRRPKSQADSSLRLVDAFCGAGGISLGFSAAGIAPLFAFDIDPDAISTYRDNVTLGAETWDVADPQLPAKLNALIKDSRYCLAGGPPCQGFSHQRRGIADDPRNELVLRFADLIESLQTPPSAIILENVTDLELPRGHKIKAEFIARLNTLGYTTIRHELNSADFGTPQLRRRIILVALPHSVASVYEAPAPLTPKRWPTVGEALNGLELHTRPSTNGSEIANHEPSQEGAQNRRRIAYVDMGFGRKSIPPDLQLPCHAASYRGHRDVFGRLDWFSQARTITGGFDSFTRGEFAHPYLHRSITPREAARIQGFPDRFVFRGNRASVRRQIGNAVPPPMAFALAKAIAIALGKGATYKWAS
jgi:DNA (cytosine-5)-methyltransferase 1